MPYNLHISMKPMPKLKSVIFCLVIFCVIFNVKPLNAQQLSDNSQQPGFRMHYMGNVEVGNLFPWDHFMNNSSGIASITTTHGVVIKPWLYAGLGTGFWLVYSHDGIAGGFPLFADIRLTYPIAKWRPFLDVKIGSFVGGSGFSHFIIQPSVGLKYAVKDTFGVYLSFSTLNSFLLSSGSVKSAGLSINLGFDF